MAEREPRPGWIYIINPKRVYLKCKSGHEHIYNISGPEELDFSQPSCTSKINSSRIMRGMHPYIVWSDYSYGKFRLYHAMPLTSKDTFRGLPTAYPIKANPSNGLTCNSLALVHQLTPIDPECFKDTNGRWIKRLGGINPDEKKDLNERVRFALSLQNEPNEDWFIKNASVELLEKVFLLIEPSKREEAVAQLLDQLD